MAAHRRPGTVAGMTEPAFPGRWLGGSALVAGPLLMLTGVLLRAGTPFFFPEQLAAHDRHPVRFTVAYGAVAAGAVLLWPAVVTLAQRVAVTRPGWAVWGGALAGSGLFGRVFHAGEDHLALQLVDVQGVDAATGTVAAAYGAYSVLSVLNLAIVAGWAVLAVGAWRGGALGPVRACCLAAAGALPLGVLKGTTPWSVVAVAGLAVALVPLGVEVLRDGPAPRPVVAAGWSAAVVVALAAGVLFGIAG